MIKIAPVIFNPTILFNPTISFAGFILSIKSVYCIDQIQLNSATQICISVNLAQVFLESLPSSLVVQKWFDNTSETRGLIPK
jgi:hypothetical protein